MTVSKSLTFVQVRLSACKLEFKHPLLGSRAYVASGPREPGTLSRLGVRGEGIED